MTDGPFEIGDRVISLSSVSEGPPLGLRGLVRSTSGSVWESSCWLLLYCIASLWTRMNALTCRAYGGLVRAGGLHGLEVDCAACCR